MTPPHRVAACALAGLLVGAAAPGQTLVASPLVHGQEFSVVVTGAPAPSDAAFLIGVGGVGPGACFPGIVCLDLLDPWMVAAILPAAGGSAGIAGIVPPTFPLIEIDLQAVIVAPAPGGFAAAKTAAEVRFVQPISALSDGFDGAALASDWILHEAGELAPPVVGGSALYLTPVATGPAAVWFNDDEGPALFKRVTGDFTATSIVHVSNPLALSPIPVPPPTSFRLGGLVARDPAGASGTKNSVHVAVGAGVPGFPLVVEDKNTVLSSSVYAFHPTASHHVELRLRRVGALVECAWRPTTGGAWTIVATHARPDLPPTLHVGPMVYSYDAPSLIEARFDDVAFGP
ncbi:MAG TPA: hypothetical protein VEI02_12385 [Planctomycetota bacterium]|nr:hypothetical protein [Planctomycetota bacterium]